MFAQTTETTLAPIALSWAYLVQLEKLESYLYSLCLFKNEEIGLQKTQKEISKEYPSEKGRKKLIQPFSKDLLVT